MAANHATSTPIKGQAYRLTGAIIDAATAVVITGGLSSLAVTISLDGGAFSATGCTIAEIGTTGWFTLDIAAAQMNYDTIAVHITEATAGSADLLIVLNPVDLTEFTGVWADQTIKRLEHLVLDVAADVVNGATVDGTTMTLTNRGGTTKATATVIETSTLASKGELS